MAHDIKWFSDRMGKDVVRMYKGNDTVVTIIKGADKYMHGLQEEGFTFRDTGATLASMDFDLPVVEGKAVTKPRIHVSDTICESCSG